MNLKKFVNRMVSVFLLLALIFNSSSISSIVYADTTESFTAEEAITNNVDTESKSDKVENVTTNNKLSTEIMMMNYITTKTEEILQTKNRIILDDIEDMIDTGLALTKIDVKTKKYFNTLRDSIKELKLDNNKRDRIEYIYSQKEANAMQAALAPSITASILTAAVSNANNPVTAVLSVGALALDRVSAYKKALDEAEDNYLKGGWELKDTELENITKLKSDLFNYRHEMKEEYKIPEEMILYKELVEEYEKRRRDIENHTMRIKFYEDHLDNYKGFPLIYLELSKSYYADKQYKKCVDAIDKYMNSNVDIFRCDKNLAEVLPLGFAAATMYMSNSQYEEYANKLLSKCKDIFKNDVNNALRELKFKYVIINMDLYKRTKIKSYIDEAFKQCHSNLEPFVREQRDLYNNKKIKKIKEIKDGKEVIKEEVIIDTKNEVSENLILNLETLLSINEVRKISEEEKRKINKLLFADKYKELFTCVPLNERYYLGDFGAVSKTTNQLLEENKDRGAFFTFKQLGDSNTKLICTVRNHLVTKDASFNINIGGTEYVAEKISGETLDENLIEYIFTYDGAALFNDFNNSYDARVTINPKSGIECKKLEFDLDFIRVKETNGKVDKLANYLKELGFDENKIFSKEQRTINQQVGSGIGAGMKHVKDEMDKSFNEGDIGGVALGIGRLLGGAALTMFAAVHGVALAEVIDIIKDKDIMIVKSMFDFDEVDCPFCLEIENNDIVSVNNNLLIEYK